MSAFPPSTSSRNQTLGKFFFMHCFLFPQLITIFFGQNSSIFQHSLLDNIPLSFLGHETSSLKFLTQSVVLLPGDPSFLPFDFPSSRILGGDSTLFEG